MSEQTSTDTRLTFLVEHYRPGFASAELEDAAARVRAAIEQLEREGQRVRFRHATIVASDESFLCVIEARSEDLVRQACARAHMPVDRISVALTRER
jgi:hypothetical protein